MKRILGLCACKNALAVLFGVLTALAALFFAACDNPGGPLDTTPPDNVSNLTGGPC